MIRLANFRCWEDKTITIPEKGIVLLSGRSGRGKSTILNSLVYAITGKGKNITTFQKKSTTVQIDLDGMTIIRQRGPSRLLVKKGEQTYEDDVAQGIIDSVFGSEFCNTSYIDQENANSFVFLSPSEKTEFLEKLLLHRYHIEEMKEKVKDAVSKTKLDHASAESQKTTLSNMLSKLTYTPQEDVFIESVKLSSQNRNKLHEKVSSNLEISEKNNKTVAVKIKKWEQERTLCARANETRRTLHIKLDDVNEQLSKYDVLSLRSELSVLEKRKERYQQNKSYVRFQELERSYKERVEHNQKEKEVLCTHLAELPSIDTIKKTISQLDAIDRLMNSLIVLEDKMAGGFTDDENNAYDDMLQQLVSKRDTAKDRQAICQKTIDDHQKYYPCPSCKSSLQFQQNKLILGKNTSVYDISDVKNELKELSSHIDVIQKQIDDLKMKKVLYDKHLTEYNELFDKLDSLLQLPTGETIDQEAVDESREKIVTLQTTYDNIQQSIREIDNDRFLSQLKKEMDAYKDKDISDSEIDIPTEKEYPGILDEIASKKEMVDRVQNLLQKKESLQTSLDELPPIEKTDEEFDELISQHREKMENYQKKTEQYRIYLQKIEKWDTIERDNATYQGVKMGITDAEMKKVSLMDRLRCLVKLRDHIKHAEQQSLTEFIDALNRHAAIYIEDFFPDDDITVEMRTVQEGKGNGKEKITLHFDVQYRNMSGDLSFLSGGEKDRVNLAFTLAFSELVENRVLLLDECISSLDAETSNIVLEQLKEKYKGKLVIVVSHQANLGFFDQVIEV